MAIRRSLVLVPALLAVASVLGADSLAGAANVLEASHKQVRTLRPTRDGKPIHLNTFCVDASGNILAAVGGESYQAVGPDGNSATLSALQIYSPEWELIGEVELDFNPTAVNVDRDGTFYVAGQGVVCKFDSEARLLKRAVSPSLGNPDELKKLAAAKIVEQRKSQLEAFQPAIDSLKKLITKAEQAEAAKSEGQATEEEATQTKTDSATEADSASTTTTAKAAASQATRANEGDASAATATTSEAGENESAADAAGAEGDADDGQAVEEGDDPYAAAFGNMSLSELKEQLKIYEQAAGQSATGGEPTDEEIAGAVKEMGRITAVAAGDAEVFVVCAAQMGYGYDLWAVNKELEQPRRVKTDLSGCCGQMDVQARGKLVLIAENTKFKVGIYDQDGKSILSFGKGDRRGVDGFGSCCNPMNLHCCENGDILTAESSVGNIKRFDAAGNLLANIGRAKIGSGCKHVAIGHDAKLDRYYMMYQDESAICVLVPKSEAPGETEDERDARLAAEGLGKKLSGTWVAKAAGSQTQEKKQGGFFDFYAFSSATFEPDRTCRLNFTNKGLQLQCNAYDYIRQSDNRVEIVILSDSVEFIKLAVEFTSDDVVRFGFISAGGSEPDWTNEFERAASGK